MKKRNLAMALVAALFAVSAQAMTITAKNDIRSESKYYVRYDYMTLENAQQVGLTSLPGTPDDEGYCSINSSFDFEGNHRIIKKGEVLDVVGTKQWTRKVLDWHNNQEKEVTDVFSTARFADDGTVVTIGCSIDSSASELEAYKPVTDDYTKAYLTTLDLFVSP